jgi:hypothetical protein
MASPTHTSLPLPDNLWLHGLIMVILVLLVNLAQTILGLCATIQFFWMLFARERNSGIARFGEGVAHWLAVTSRFLSGAADQRPFPWTAWNNPTWDNPNGEEGKQST